MGGNEAACRVQNSGSFRSYNKSLGGVETAAGSLGGLRHSRPNTPGLCMSFSFIIINLKEPVTHTHAYAAFASSKNAIGWRWFMDGIISKEMFTLQQEFTAIVGLSLSVDMGEDLQRDIEKQLDAGEEGLEEEDKYLLDINLKDLETISG